MKVASLFLAIALKFTLTLTQQITQDTVDYGTIDIGVGDIDINPNVYYSIINNAITAIVGSLNVGDGGGFYISSVSNLIGLDVTLTGGNVFNNGTISFNSVASILPSTYIITTLGSFVNDGDFYMGSNGAIGSGVFTINSPVVTNNGLMVFYQTQNNGGQVILGGTNLLNGITNNGQICLYNELYEQLSDIDGTGCITTQANSTVFVSNPLANIGGQTIYLADGQSSVIANPLLSGNPINVAGFGNGNMVALSTTLVPNVLGVTRPYAYNTQNGQLTLYGLTGSQVFNIGTGYDANDFAVTTDWDAVADGVILPFNAVTYNGPVPNPSLPSNCALCNTLPAIPGLNGTDYTTTVTTTENGQVCTDIEEVAVTSDSSGNFYNTTILISAYCSSTESTALSSSSEASSSSSEASSSSSEASSSSSEASSSSSEASSSSSEASSSSSEASSSSSEASPSSSEASPSSSEASSSSSEASSSSSEASPSSSEASSSSSSTGYTAKATSTLSNGIVTTESAEVIVSTNSEGVWYTTTSIIEKCSCSEYTTTIVTTDTVGVPCTSSGVVIITTNDKGEYYTSTSIIGTKGNSIYTTTIVTTNTVGVPCTETGVVSVGTDSEGHEYTSTSFISGNSVVSAFTTTIIKGSTEGEESTQIANIVVKSGSEGSLYTSTYIIGEATAGGEIVGTTEASQASETDISTSSSATSPESTVAAQEGSSNRNQGSILFTLIVSLVFTFFI
ncbi:Hyphally regulated cell wall protein N-terminal-domain-containing protein [Scheffersomyces amazonensis]|uniref:Hyphally regulated cell wall protein N-terminal-domain-containing protein n=1 Tax=Scheffersomyces amazonensis TaxID=1078765 RepID=UPI00315C7EDB